MAACAVGAFGVAGNVITIAVLMRMRTNRNFNNLVRLLIVLQLRCFVYFFSFQLVALGVADIALIVTVVVDMSIIQVRRGKGIAF